MAGGWRIELLGTLQARRDDEIVARFRSHQAGGLLAHLAFARRSVRREELIESLWPGCEAGAGRNRLSVALSSLKAQLGDIFEADRDTITLRSGTFSSDTGAFETLLRRAAQATEADEQIELLTQATALYKGVLLPGYDEEWIVPQRGRLEENYFRAVRRLMLLHREKGDWPRAIGVGERALSFDSAREEVAREVLQMQGSARRFDAARRQMQSLETALREQLNREPDAATRRVWEQIAQMARENTAPARVSGIANAPRPRTRFFGRESDLLVLEDWLKTPDEPLLTLTGAGGSGKTRLASELARLCAEQVESHFPGGAWWANLADVNETSLLFEALRTALHLPPLPQEPLEQILPLLSAQPALLILDNFEQLLPEGAPCIETLFNHAPQLKVLVTSRRRLLLPGEREHLVMPLESDGAGIALFCDRARLAHPAFVESDEAAELVRRLDGIPLALELAGARAGVLTPRQMLAHLEAREPILISTAGPARHRTLSAAIEWSFRLLTPDLQKFWLRLSVFRGGCSLEAVRAVCGSKGLLEALSQLRDSSLLLGEDSNGQMRFRLLEPLREWAGERMALPERFDAARQHGLYFLEIAEFLEPQLPGPNGAPGMARLNSEAENLRAALNWAVTCEPEIALRLAIALTGFWERRGAAPEGERWLQAALDASRGDEFALVNEDGTPGAGLVPLPGLVPFHPLWAEAPLDIAPAHWRARALCEMGRLALLHGGHRKAQEVLVQSIELHEIWDDVVAAAWAHNYLGQVLLRCGKIAQARDCFERAIEVGRIEGQWQLLADALDGLSNTAALCGDKELLHRAATETLERRHSLGDRRGAGFALNYLGWLALLQDDNAQAQALFEESLSIFRAFDDPWAVGQSLLALGVVQRRSGQFETAYRTLRESLDALRRANAPLEIAGVFDQMAYLACEEKLGERALMLLGAGAHLRHVINAILSPLHVEEQAPYLETLSAAFSEAEFARLWQQGQRLRDDAIQFAMQDS